MKRLHYFSEVRMNRIETLNRFLNKVCSVFERFQFRLAECIHFQIPWLQYFYIQFIFPLLQKIFLDGNNCLPYRLMKLRTVFRRIVKAVEVYEFIIAVIIKPRI